MRTRLVWLTLVLSPALVHAQDAGAIAAQQAAQQSQMAMQAAQLANQQAMQAAQQANEQAANNTQIATRNFCQPTGRPKFSVKPGSYPSSVTVKIRDNTRGATIYYTTDGWTPTTESTRYTGPITIDSTTKLSAIAVAPGAVRSRVASAQYVIGTPNNAGVANAQPQTSVPRVSTDSSGKAMIPHGTALPLLFASELSSKTADVGDKISLTLAEDIKAGDVVLLHKGALATGTVTETDKSRAAGVPGEIVFKVESLAQDGTTIKLRGSAAKEGEDKYSSAAALMVVVPGPFGLLEHGEEAEIKQGTPFTAYVEADTILALKN